MLNIYYGRENTNKEAFAFREIKKALRENEVLVLVPDQFKLITEMAAMEYMEVQGLMGLEVMSLRRLGEQILNEFGGTHLDYIDKYGRHIILTDIMEKKKSELKVYARQGHRNSFIEMVNNLISELKRFGVTVEVLRSIVDDQSRDESKAESLLAAKLRDILIIYEEYEKRIEGKYVDTEDRTNIFLKHIAEAEILRNKTIWMWGFDWLSPKDLNVLEELMKVCSVNLMFTYDTTYLFEITGEMIRKLKGLADSNGIGYRVSQIDDKKQVAPAISGIERALFKLPKEEPTQEELNSAKEAVTLVSAASFHSEAETAAAYILGLVRDEGYRYKDIALICNDQGERGEVIRQTFAEYGIEVYVDRRRSILRHPAVGFLTSLMEIAAKGYRTETIFSMLKTGFGPLSETQVEKLENYAVSYKIKGTKWTKPFAEVECEESRQKLMAFIESFNKEYKRDRFAVARTEAIYEFLRDKVNMPAILQERIDGLVAEGKLEEAGEIAQLWNSIIAVLSQMVTVMGETKVSLETYEMLLTAGMGAVEIGILPPGSDGLIMGTMQRSRLGDVKALVIIGANEGVIPMGHSGTSILSDREIQTLSSEGKEIAKSNSLQAMEEQLSMYRILSEPKEKLYMSYSMADSQGGKLRPAEIYNDIKRFYDIKPRVDILSDADNLKRIEAPLSTLRHLSQEAAKAKRYNTELEPVWQESYAWCEKNVPEETAAMLSGLSYRNHQDKLSKDLVHGLYNNSKGNIKVSPSSFERYIHCPFSFFVQAGLNPQERRIYQVGSREIGDLYHETLERVMRELSSDGLKVKDANSNWQTKSRQELDEMTARAFDKVAEDYRGGLANAGAEEKYRTSRMREAICDNLWALVNHVRCGRVDTIRLEQSFGDYSNATFPAISIKAGEETVQVTGKIDRVDVLENGRVKIIDYKSGRNEIKKEDIEKGLKIQLMLYLKAATKDELAPAGIFYYQIHSGLLDAKTGESIEQLQAKLNSDLEAYNLYNARGYRLKGLIIDEPENMNDILGGPESGYPVVEGCSFKGGSFSGKAVVTDEEFAELRKSFDQIIQSFCEKLAEGNIDIAPESEKSCEYCQYKSICRYHL